MRGCTPRNIFQSTFWVNMIQSSLRQVLIGGFVATILFGVSSGPAIGGIGGYLGESHLK